MALVLTAIYSISLILVPLLQSFAVHSGLNNSYNTVVDSSVRAVTVHSVIAGIESHISLIAFNDYKWYIIALFIIGSILLVFVAVPSLAQRLVKR